MSPLYLNTGPVICIPKHLSGKHPVLSAPAVPALTDKTGMLWGMDARTGVTKTGTSITQVDDISGNGRHTTYAAGKEATYVASFVDGKPAIKLLSTSLGVFTTDNMIDAGADHGFFMVIQNTAEADPYYHTYVSFRTPTAVQNQSIVLSTDPLYGLFGHIVNANTAIGNVAAVATLTSAPGTLVWNYTGGLIGATGSYNAKVNNSTITLTNLTGGTAHNTNANNVNSYANSSPPQFPATNCHVLVMCLYDSPISAADITNVFKPHVQGSWPSIVQA